MWMCQDVGLEGKARWREASCAVSYYLALGPGDHLLSFLFRDAEVAWDARGHTNKTRCYDRCQHLNEEENEALGTCGHLKALFLVPCAEVFVAIFFLPYFMTIAWRPDLVELCQVPAQLETHQQFRFLQSECQLYHKTLPSLPWWLRISSLVDILFECHEGAPFSVPPGVQ